MADKQRDDSPMLPDTTVQRWHAMYWTGVVAGAFVLKLILIILLDDARA